MKSRRWQKKILNHNLFLFMMFTLLNIAFAFAGPSRTTYQAKIIKPDGYPLEATNVNFKFTILDPAGSCMLYAETFSGVNMGSSAGLVSFSLGNGVRTFPVSGSTFEQVFSNTTASLTCDAGGPGTYSPLSTDTRRVVMQFNDGGGWQTLPAMTINAVPYAMYANDSLKFSGKDVTDFVQVASLPTCTASQAMSFNGAGFSCIAAGGTGSVSSAAVVAALGYTPADGASLTTITSNVNSVSSTVFSVSSTVTSLQNSVAASFASITSSQWLASGTTISYSSGNVGIGTSDPQRRFVVRNDTTNTLTNSAFYNADTTNNNAVVLSFRSDTSGTSGVAFHQTGGISVITTEHNHNTRNSNLGFYTDSASSPSALRMNITGLGNVGIGITNPVTKLDVAGGIRLGAEAATCSAGYAGTLRYNAGTVEYCNGTSWVTFGVSGAGILAINGLTSGSQTFAVGSSGNLPNINSAGTVHTFNFPMAASAATTAGLLSYADYLSFANKQAATSAAITTTLGYTPANAVSVTTLSSTVSSLSSSVAASFSAITSSQWVSSGSTIHYNSGNIGMGTSSPAAALHLVTQNTASPAVVIDTDSDVGDQAFKIRASGDGGAGLTDADTKFVVMGGGNVGIGTTSAPTAPLEIATGASSVKLGFNAPAFGTMIDFGSAGGWAREYSFAYAGSKLGSFGYLGNTSATTYLYINANQAGSITGHNAPDMVITPLGKVGIGNTAPTAKLHLGAGTSVTAAVRFTASTLTTSAQTGAMEYDGSNFYLTDETNNRRAIATGSSSGTIDNASTINSTGNITMVPVGSVVVSSTTASTNSQTGALVVKGGMGVAGTVNIAGSLNTSGSLTVGSDLTANNMKSYILSRAVPAAIDDYVELGRFAYGNRSYNLRVSVSVDAANIAILKSYILPVRYFSGTDWYTALPISQSIWGTNNVDLDVMPGTFGDPAVYLRLRRSAGALAATASIKIEQEGYAATTFTAMTGTGTGSASTTFFESTALTQLNGRVGIGTAAPNVALDVVGAYRISATASSAAFIEMGNTNFGSLNPGISTVNGGYIQSPLNGSLVIDLKNNQTDDAIAIRYSNAGNGNVDSIGMVFNGQGRMGIGTSSPASTLHVSGTIRADENLTVTGAGSFLNNGSGVLVLRPASNDFRVQNSTGAFDYLTVKAGNVGIGTSAPATRLHIVDNVANILLLERTNNQNSLIEYKNTLGSVFAGQINGSTNWGVGPGLDLGANGIFQVTSTGRVYIGGTAAPTARLHITPGTSQVAPIRLALGTLVTSPQSGTIEYDGSYYYITDNAGIRRTIATASTAGTLNDINTVSSTSGIVLWPASGNSVTVSSTVASTNSSTGALIVNGGAGISGALNVGGIISGSAIIKGTGFRANQGAPDAADSSTVGYAFGQDGDTGIFSPGAGGSANGILSFYSNNAERMRMTASGSLGIGVIPAAPLHVSNTSTQVKLILGKDDNSIAESSLLKIDAAGSSSYTAGMVLTSGGNQTAGAAIFRPSGTGGLYFKGQTSFTTMTGATTPDLYVGTNGHVGVGIANPTYQFTVAKDFAGLTSQTAAFIGGIDAATANSGIYVMTKDNTGLGSNNSYLLNAVHNNLSKFIVTGAGNVGIGTTAPQANLHLNNTTTPHASGTEMLRITAPHLGATAGSGGILKFTNNVATADAAAIKTYTNGANDVSLKFMTGYGVGTLQDRMTIANAGEVGIGTTNPSSILSVEQNANADTFVNVTNNGSGTLARAGVVMTNEGTVYGPYSGGMLLGGVSNTTAPDQLALFSNSGIASGINISASTGGIRFATGATERMRVDGTTGYIGIGTTAPAGQLHIGKQEAAPGTSGTMSRLILQPYGHTGGPWKMDARDFGADAFLDFKYGGNNIMTFEDGGKIGIGTASPTTTLHVNGSVRIVDGNEAAGRVLASDASGNASWKQAIIHGTIASNSATSDGTVRVGTGVSITLPPGRWQITGMGITVPTVSCRADFGIRNTGTNAIVKYTLMPAPTNDYTTATVTAYVDIAVTTSYDLYIISRGACTSQVHSDNNLWELTATGVAY